MKLNELFDQYSYLLKDCEINRMKLIKECFEDYLNLDIKELSKERFREVLTANNLSVDTVFNIYKIINKFYYQAYKDKVIDCHYLRIKNNTHYKNYYEQSEINKILEILDKENTKPIKILLLAFNNGIRIKDLLRVDSKAIYDDKLHFKNNVYELDDKYLEIIKNYKSKNSRYLFSKCNGERLNIKCFRNSETYLKIMSGIDDFKILRFEEFLSYSKRPTKVISYKELCEGYFNQYMLNDCLKEYELNRIYIKPYLDHLNANEISNEDIELVFRENAKDTFSDYRFKRIHYFLRNLFKYGLKNSYTIYPLILTRNKEYLYSKYPNGIKKKTLTLDYEEAVFKDLTINLLSPFSTVAEYYFSYVDKDNRTTIVNGLKKIAYPFFKDKHVSEINEVDIINLLKEYKNYYGQWTVFPIKCLLRKLFRYIYESGLNAHNFINVLYLEEANRTPLVIFNNDQIEKIINSASSTCYKNLIIFSISSGLRFNEAIVLKWEDIDFKEKAVYIKRTYVDYGRYIRECSGKKKRKIYLSDVAYKALNDAKDKSVDEYVFIDKEREKYLEEIKKYLSKFIAADSGIDDFSLSDLFNNLINKSLNINDFVSLNSIAGYEKLETLNKRLLKLEDNYQCLTMKEMN